MSLVACNVLQVAAGDRKAELHSLVLELQRGEARKYLEMGSREIARAVQRQAVDRVLHEREHEACHARACCLIRPTCSF